MKIDEKFLLEALKIVGVSEFDQRVYLVLVKKPGLSVAGLAAQLSVERPTIYSALERLQNADLIASKRQFSRSINVEPPNRILALMRRHQLEFDQKKKNFEEVLPHFMADFSEKTRPRLFRLFEGQDQFLTMFEESILDAQGEILYFGDVAALDQYIGIERENAWIKKRVEKNLPLKMLIFRDKSAVQRYALRDKKELRETKFIKGNKFKSSFMVYGTKTLLWNPNAERALVIDDPEITVMFRKIFDDEWLTAENPNSMR